MSNPFHDIKVQCNGCQSDINLIEKPEPGHVNICHKCGKLFVFSGSMALVEMTPEMEHVFKFKYPRHSAAIEEIRWRIAQYAKRN